MTKELIFYESPTGAIPFKKWLSKIKDVRAQVKIEKRLDRLTVGQYGDCKHIRACLKSLLCRPKNVDFLCSAAHLLLCKLRCGAQKSTFFDAA